MNETTAAAAAEHDTVGGEVVEDNTQGTSESGVEIEADRRGNVYLPGTAPIVDQQLADAAGKFVAANTEWKDAGQRRKDAKTELAAICELKSELFKPDPENTNARVYHAGGMTIRISETTKEDLQVEIDGEDDG